MRWLAMWRKLQHVFARHAGRQNDLSCSDKTLLLGPELEYNVCMNDPVVCVPVPYCKLVTVKVTPNKGVSAVKSLVFMDHSQHTALSGNQTILVHRGTINS